MQRILLCSVMLTLTTSAAVAQKKAKEPPPAPATLPALGELLPLTGTPSWGKHEWLYDAPDAKDAAGKIVVHWFCGPKVKTCADDLARVVTLKEGGKAYVVAHIDGNKAAAKKLDPIRESEGVGQGTVGYGKGATTLMKQLGVTGPASIVVDVEGKVALVSTNSTPTDLDARDAKVNELAGAIKAYSATVSESPKALKPGDKFTLSISIQLAKWLSYSAKTPRTFKLTVPPDFKCDAKELTGDQIKVDGNAMTAALSCTAPKGIYEARGELRFGYATGSGDGLGTEGGKWKFEVKP
jgi:hypothetical protein